MTVQFLKFHLNVFPSVSTTPISSCIYHQNQDHTRVALLIYLFELVYSKLGHSNFTINYILINIIHNYINIYYIYFVCFSHMKLVRKHYYTVV